MSVNYRAGIVCGYPVKDADIERARAIGLTEENLETYRITLDAYCGTDDYIFGIWCGQAPMGGFKALDEILCDDPAGDMDNMITLYNNYFKHKPAQPRLLLVGQVD